MILGFYLWLWLIRKVPFPHVVYSAFMVVLIAGLGMLLAFFIFWSGREKYSDAPGLNITEAGKKKVFAGLNMAQVVGIGSLLVIPVCYYFIQNNSWLDYILLGLFVYVSISLVIAGKNADKSDGVSVWRDRMIALIIFILINIFSSFKYWCQSLICEL